MGCSLRIRDCGFFDDAAYYLILDKGLCYDTKTGQEGTYDDCASWEDLTDSDGDYGEDAQKYIDANGLCKTGLSFAVFAFIALLLQFLPALSKFSFVRYIIGAVFAFIAILFVAAMGTASNTVYTDQDNYGPDAYCSSSASSMYSGYACAVIALILAGSTAFAVVFPCCNCVDRNPASNDNVPVDAAATANPIA